MTKESTPPARRDFFRLAGAISAVAALPGAASAQAPAPASIRREALEALTASEADTLEAICARLIPSDANGPGAAEARVAHYIDRALASALAASREDYRSGLGALDTYARTSRGGAFASLAPAMQDAVLTELEKNTAPGFTPDSATFFTLVRGHVLQGMFGDPYYGGNYNYIGWDMIGYPGIRLAVSAAEQAEAAHLPPVRKSAYDFTMFDRASAAAAAARPAPVSEAQMPEGMGMKGMDHDH